jgi:hypothetical protein
MASPIGNKREIKIFVLYLMDNIGYPLEFTAINDIVMQTDYVAYLDFAESFNELLDGDLVAPVPGEAGKGERYAVTDKGRTVADQLHGNIADVILDKSLSWAYRYLDFRRRGVEIRTDMKQLENGRVDVTFRLVENRNDIFSLTLQVENSDRAEKMRERFRDRPEVIYRGVNALLTGSVDFLFDS